MTVPVVLKGAWRSPVILTSPIRAGEEGSAAGFLVARRDAAPRNDKRSSQNDRQRRRT
jgi:hypothetical protein